MGLMMLFVNDITALALLWTSVIEVRLILITRTTITTLTTVEHVYNSKVRDRGKI